MDRSLLELTQLTGTHVRLAPLNPQHEPGLADAVRDGELWNLWYTSAPRPEAMAVEIARRLALHAAGSMLPWTVFDRDGRIAGMTTFMNIDSLNRRVEIGSTWYARRVQRTALNTEAKLLLLTHAFEHLGCIAVEFRTHFLNHQSRRAIERLGARCDGVLRNHMVSPNGTLRDTVVYSVIPGEWPAVKANLEWQLARPR